MPRGAARPDAAHLATWGALSVCVAGASLALSKAGAPSPTLFGAFVAGIGFALLSRTALDVPSGLSVAAQSVIGVAVGTYLQRSTLSAVGAKWASVVPTCLATLALSILAGLVLAKVAPLDRATSSFGMIAGGAAGIIAISRDLGADERMVAVLQYLRLLIIVALTPLIATTLFGASALSARPGAGGGLTAVGFVALCASAGVVLGRLARLPAGNLLGPLAVAAVCSIGFGPGSETSVPPLVQDCAFALIGLQVGLQFTIASLREARALLPAAVTIIAAMILISAGLGAILAFFAHVTQLDGYLATTPGGFSAVVAFTLGTNANFAFVLSVQVARTLIMLMAAPPLARWVARRGEAALVHR